MQLFSMQTNMLNKCIWVGPGLAVRMTRGIPKAHWESLDSHPDSISQSQLPANAHADRKHMMTQELFPCYLQQSPNIQFQAQEPDPNLTTVVSAEQTTR